VRASKTESGIRTVPLLPELRTDLENWRGYLEGIGLYQPRGPVLAVRRRPNRRPGDGSPDVAQNGQTHGNATFRTSEPRTR
jgi:hypothetical protein